MTIYILSSCYNVKEIGIVSTKEVPNSKKMTGRDFLRVDTTIDYLTTPKNPYINTRAFREVEYSTKTINKIQINRKVNDGTKAALVGTLIVSFITPVIYTYTSGYEYEKGEPWLYGGLFAVGIGAAEAIIWFGLKAFEGNSHKNKPGPPKINCEINPISNELIKHLSKSLSQLMTWVD